MSCKKLEGCAFFQKCEELGKDTAANGFKSMYCLGSKIEECTRYRLSNKFGKDVVPENMMPNGYPIAGTTTDGWNEKAANYNKHI